MKELSFTNFFRDVHEVPPFPWQVRLATQLIEQHTWPDLIDLPTASGKTACIDIALFHLAWCAELGEPWRAARRIVFVVDRRIIVDAAAERAERILGALKEGRTESIRAVAHALQRLGGALPFASPLVCQKLRGGMPRERGFALDPSQPMVITSTVDQVGSRMLFRGYGLSPYARPVHAGLLGYDTLYLLDEAHLSVPFIQAIAAVRREQSRAERALAAVLPARLVPLSATASTIGDRFQLDDRDLGHARLVERRTASKQARLVESTNKAADRLKILLRETLAVYGDIGASAAAVAVIVNRVGTARAVFDELHEKSINSNFDVELLIGRSRPLDRDVLAKRLIKRTGAGRTAEPADRGLIVVATQTIEVGADLDFQGLVTECAALDALRQRFGRLDRLGQFRRARAVVIGGGDTDEDPVYGHALNKTWRWLCSIAASKRGHNYVDFSIEAMHQATEGADIQAMAAHPRTTLQLTPAHVQLLCQTYPNPMYGPDIGALLHGLDAAPPDVQLIWRADIPVGGDGERIAIDTGAIHAVRHLLELNPPSSLETLALPLHTARAWLDGTKHSSALADLEGTKEDGPDDEKISGLQRQVWRRNGNEWEAVSTRQLSPGDIIVIPSAYAGCDEFGFAPDSNVPVRDLSARARTELKRSPLLVITSQALASFAGVDGNAAMMAWRNASESLRTLQTEPEELLNEILAVASTQFRAEHPWLFSDPLVEIVTTGEGELYAVVASSRHLDEGDLSDEDLSSSQTVPVPLGQHNAGVGQRARSLAASVALSIEHVDTLGRAGDLHDVGKADPRFQRLLRSGDDAALPGQLLAKGWRRTKGPRVELGERHEAYSVAFLKKYPELLDAASDPELALYLVGSHHGRGRALMPDRTDDGTEFFVELSGQTFSFAGAPRLGALDSGWPTLFWRLNQRYGAWGLAYLEAILRLADHLRSAEDLKQGIADG